MKFKKGLGRKIGLGQTKGKQEGVPCRKPQSERWKSYLEDRDKNMAEDTFPQKELSKIASERLMAKNFGLKCWRCLNRALK